MLRVITLNFAGLRFAASAAAGAARESRHSAKIRRRLRDDVVFIEAFRLRAVYGVAIRTRWLIMPAIAAAVLSFAPAAGAAGSDAWVQAQEAISRVEAARETGISALAELDRYVATRADEPTNQADHEALIAAVRAAEAMVADQQRRLDALRSSVSRP